MTLLIIIVIAFAFNNVGTNQKIDVNLQPFYYNYTQVPLLTVVMWSVIAGMLISILLFILMYIKMAVGIRSANTKIRALESEMAILRNRPIEESVDLLKGLDSRKHEIKSVFDEV
ncbi:MAG: lipopolysaccharide assembly protein LapA domain-containing protein [candidate division Zixibacteria bacterium]|nr:lipopolysaccharide assembly protein LapA domain-containing protein [candidate division Zixibacteria bacterium]